MIRARGSDADICASAARRATRRRCRAPAREGATARWVATRTRCVATAHHERAVAAVPTTRTPAARGVQRRAPTRASLELGFVIHQIHWPSYQLSSLVHRSVRA
eukprot:scaffold64938_cov69-Phaeocystis_antarctica.AAC.1